jgi:YD repeat-containing protein
LWKVTDPDSKVEEYTYDGSGRMLTIQDKRGNVVVTNTYDGSGRVATQTLADTGVFQFSYTTDGSGKITRTDVTDPRNYVERIEFNSGGFVTSSTRAYGTALAQTVTCERQSGTNLLTATVDALSRRTEYTCWAKLSSTKECTMP